MYKRQEYKAAEDCFIIVLEVQPGNYLASRELAEVKINFIKFHNWDTFIFLIVALAIVVPLLLK